MVGIFPQAAAALRSADGIVMAQAPAGTVTQTGTLVYIPEERAALPPPNPGFSLGSAAFSVQATDADGRFLANTLLQNPLTLTVRYSPADAQAAGADPARLMLASYRPEERQWMILETQVDTAAGTASAPHTAAGIVCPAAADAAAGAAGRFASCHGPW